MTEKVELLPDETSLFAFAAASYYLCLRQRCSLTNDWTTICITKCCSSSFSASLLNLSVFASRALTEVYPPVRLLLCSGKPR